MSADQKVADPALKNSSFRLARSILIAVFLFFGLAWVPGIGQGYLWLYYMLKGFFLIPALYSIPAGLAFAYLSFFIIMRAPHHRWLAYRILPFVYSVAVVIFIVLNWPSNSRQLADALAFYVHSLPATFFWNAVGTYFATTQHHSQPS